MMFDVNPGQIDSLTSLQLVQLLGRLLHAEAQAADVPLGNINVPLQITIPDGGEDGRIVWKNGRDSTNYLPGRQNFFQCKASNFGRDGWKKECWTKSSRRRGTTRVLAPALKSISAVNGHYVGFTTEALTGQKIDDYAAAIEEGITEAGGDPNRLGSIKLYGSNEIAAWATSHPSVAIWLGEIAHRQTLGGFRTVEAWGQRGDFVDQPYADDGDNRYIIGTTRTRELNGSDNSTSAKAAWAKVLEHVTFPGQSVRISGASGLGKSRFVYESLRSSSSIVADIVSNSTIFADYRVVSNTLLPIAAQLADGHHDILLVVDECPREAAIELGQLAGAGPSRLRVITIDTDDRPLDKATLHLSVLPSDGDLIGAIIRSKNPDVTEATISRLRDVCGGYPKFAVLVAATWDLSTVAFETIDDIVNRVLRGSSVTGTEEIRALECLAMFDRLSIEGEGNPLDLVAKDFARMSGDEMYEHLSKAQDHDLVGRYRDQFAAQPRPIAEHLAHRRLKLVRPSLLEKFVLGAPDELVLSLLRRWRFMDASQLIRDAASAIADGHLSTPGAVLTARGSAILDALVHIIPDKVADRLHHLILPCSNQVLADAKEARRSIVEALSKLMFRSRSFNTAARLLMKLAAAETEEWANNATGLFKQLYQLQLSGTEVSPAERFAILDEGLDSEDEATVALCVDALGSVFTSHFSRFGATDEIGSGEPLKDWSPTTWDEVDEFHVEGLKRLLEIRKGRPELADRCETIITRATRRVLNTGIYRQHGEALVEIAKEKGGWPEAIESVGHWLYFDRKGAKAKRSRYIRDLYTRLFPEDPIDKAILFTKFWSADIRDPDAIYRESDNDFRYSERAAEALADEIAQNDEMTLEAIGRMMPLDLKTVGPFAERLSRRARQRKNVFDTALELVDEGGTGMRMLRGILRGIDLEDHSLADECLKKAVETLPVTVPLIDFYSALTIDDSRIDRVVAELQAGRIKPVECAYLSYGRGLDERSASSVSRLLDELVNHGSDGAWTALEIAMMYRHGQPLFPEFAAEIGKLLCNPALIAGNRDSNRDAHLFEDLTKQVRNAIGVDAELADGLAQQIERLAGSEEWEIFSTLSAPMRDLVSVLREDQPDVLWAHIIRFYDNATPIERDRLHRLIGPNSDRFEKSAHTEAGPLYGISKDRLFSWADGVPDHQAFLVEFFPTLTIGEDGSAWDPAFEELAARYGKAREFRAAVADRIRPKSWSGSIVPLLEVYLDPLASWSKHKIQALATWAKDQHRRLESRIEREAQHDREIGL
ncbi:hypothetical protein RGR602_PB00042 (plasmid) [Rhizobium gallicum bv. gallicum R602sp]|uniref:Uncharacterized protein n=1 Tax=Rhizobium gallicum bv. gallicum R602sp TaxID=1041138 RepID=A0A0B4XAE1_9HYPH|nr:hypothetical protein RGR602_PB00042 [Rhizobium gallicum bv. gallicum R602sp]